MDTFPIEGDDIPKGCDGWLLFLDEINSAALQVQAAAYKLIGDRKVGNQSLHPNVAIMGAGNLQTSGAVVNRLSTAMQSRLTHFEIQLDTDAWLKWAGANNINHMIMSFIGFKPLNLMRFKADHDDHTFPCPRTWENTSKMLNNWEEFPVKKLPVIAGTIGEGMAREFLGYCQIYDRLPSRQELINNPTTVDIPNEPSVKWAISGLIYLSASCTGRLLSL